MTRQRIDDTTLEAICAEFLRTALGGPDSDVGIARERNLIAYNALPEGDFAPPDVPDRSDFVATDVADTVHGLLPQLMRIFVSSDDAVEFEARKPDGEQLAKTVTAYINHLFYTRNDGLNVLYDWFHGALVQKVGFVMVWAEEEHEDERCVYEGLTEDQVAMLLQDGAQIDGEPMVDEAGTLTVAVTYEGKRMAIKVAAVAPHEMRIDPNARWGDEPAAIGREFLRRKFELDEEGIDTSQITESESSQWNSEAREMLGETADWASSDIHDSHRLVKCAELYIKLDRDGDGAAEWLKIGMVGDKIALRDGKPDVEQVDDHPFCEICPQPRPHAYFGDCPADFAYQTQLHRTRVMRALHDNLSLTVNQRTYVNTSANVNIDDLLESRPGGIVRGTSAPSEAFAPMAQPNLGQPAWQMVEWIEAWREDRTGFNRYTAGTDRDAINKTARGQELLTAKADMRTEMIARFFAQGVRKMFAKLLKLAVKHQNQQEWFKVAGEFVAVNPSEWRDQFNLRINVGLGHGSKEQQAARVMAMLPLMQLGAQAGVVRPEHMGNLIRLFAQTQEFKSPEQFADPAPQGPPPELQQMQQQAQEQMGQMQGELQKLAQENQALKGQLDNKDGENALKAQELELKAAEAVARVQAELARSQSEGAAQSQSSAEQAQGLQALMEAVQGLMAVTQQFTAPRQKFTEIVRDEAGRAIGARTVEG